MSRAKRKLDAVDETISEHMHEERRNVRLPATRVGEGNEEWVQPTLSGSNDAFRRILEAPLTSATLERKPPFPDYTKHIVLAIASLAVLLVLVTELYHGQGPKYSLGLLASVLICLCMSSYSQERRRSQERKQRVLRAEVAQEYRAFFTKVRTDTYLARRQEAG